MGHSLLTDIESAPVEAPGHDVELLGPSDSSDSGSDSAGSVDGDATTDAAGTGERRSAAHDRQPREGQDIGVDRVFSAEPATDADPVAAEEDEDPDLAFIDRARADDALDDEAQNEEGQAEEDEAPPSTSRS